MEELHTRFWPAHRPRNIHVPETSLWFNLATSAARFPQKTSLIFYDTELRYADVKSAAERLAGFLQHACGVRRGDRVALFLQNSPQFVIAYYAILRADAVVVPINPMNRALELAAIVEDAGARVIVAAQDLYEHVEPLIGRVVQHVIVACYADYLTAKTDLDVPDPLTAPRKVIRGSGIALWRDALECGYQPAAHLATADDLCVMPYTSGTTGQPKGCMHRHRSVMHTAVATAMWSGLHHEDRGLCVLPMFHVTGMQHCMNIGMYLGSSGVIMSRWNRELAGKLIERYRCTRWTSVPTMVIDFLASPTTAGYDVSSLASIGGGGAAMPEAVARASEARFGLKYLEGYGMTETMAPTHANPEAHPKRQCLGIPIFNTESRIIDPVTLADVPQGEIGEIVVRGPQIFDGYWNQPQATEEAFVTLDGKRYLRTGDLGRMDEEGYYFFVDRIKRMINASGFKVWPAEVESLLFAHPAVQEAVVIAAKDAKRGETVKALVVLKPAARGRETPERIIEWAKANMAAYKVPRVVELVESLPKSSSGKVMWRALQEQEDRASAHA
ncbi:MAG TPA: long-chain fatty acid--CoA ligase [Steroidobacteraceae bacterium]|nr:long-chain fatty acid--CoA ligase [Steroidobacteraceae bacterium]